MNKNYVYQHKAVIWKEFKETYRRYKIAIYPWVAAMLAMLFVPVAKIVCNNNIAAEVKGPMLGGFAVLIPIMVIPLFGHSIIVNTIYGERRKKTIHTLMAQGVSPIVIWFGKVIAAIMLSCAVSLCAGAVYAIIVKSLTGYSVVLEGRMLYVTLFVSPIISVGMLSIVSSCYMVLKEPRIVGLLYMMGLFYGIFYILPKITSVNISIATSSIILIIGISMISVSCVVVGNVSRERIADI